MEKVVYRFYKIVVKNTRESKTPDNRVYILSSKYTYRPMRGRVVAQLFYKSIIYHISGFRFNLLNGYRLIYF